MHLLAHMPRLAEAVAVTKACIKLCASEAISLGFW
jgi:hypothetical protein